MKSKIVILGGGNAGISAAAQLLNKNPKLNLTIVEPSDRHFYQPAWTMVGSGIYDFSKTVRPESFVIPHKANWIRKKAVGFLPEKNFVQLENNETLEYDILVVAVGIKLLWEEIRGLKDTLGMNNVCSVYSPETVEYTWKCVQNFKGGKAIFTAPHTPIKCGGAPQKIMYMASDYFRKKGLLEKSEIEFWSGGTRLFGVDKYEKTLLKVADKYKIKRNFRHKLIEVDGTNKIAVFQEIQGNHQGEIKKVPFNLLHVSPPQGPHDFIKDSPLADANGWVDVDKFTLQHKKYPNIFSLGDTASLPTSRTGAAIRKQVPVLVKNIMSFLNNQPLTASYNGYSSCPVLTGYDKLVLCEFDYNNQPAETFPFDQSKERLSMFLLKRYLLPWLYWNKILTGKM
jgi:sulfide:quinone oxidoreductase